MKRIYLLVLLLAGTAAFASGDDIRWKKNLMDGSRTGCTVPLATDTETSIGTVKGCTYIAPNGRKYRGITKKTAVYVMGLQPEMASVKTVVGHSAKAMIKTYPEGPLSNFFIDTIMKETEKVSGKKVDIGIGNFGGIRVDMPEGEIIVDDIMSMFPFRNDLVYLTIRGSEVRSLLEQMAARKFQVLGGLRVVAQDGRLVSVHVGDEPLDDDRVYGLATISFLLDGGDDLSLRTRAIEVCEYPVAIYDAIMGHIMAEEAAGRMIDAEADGRVRILDVRDEKDDSGIEYGESDDFGCDIERNLTILHTNDTHSHIDPVRGGLQDGLGGVIERAAYIDSVRIADGRRNVLLLDAGDFGQGTSYFSMFGGDAEVELMNRMEYDVACLGNHEFDNGIEELARRLAKADFEVVCANYDFSGTELEKYVKPYTIVRRAGSRIGIIGVLTDVTKVVDKVIADKMSYLDPVETVGRYAEYLKEEKDCDMVICLSHLGFDGDCTVAAASEDVDLIVGGHSHTWLEGMVVRRNAEGEEVIIVQDGCWGINIGNIRIE